ncbi:MFS transporter [Galactobacter valiniphilus]|uniref:MFS transporter n=1 Tax=Galactobacter valiniphilus TaxID=2676122 RepID=A0A399J896_9MICC|nr:MFS transporter [Galactobacter valiniphilus]RII41728.1 MFS transporter [Galactobacter valiniphilus]
MSTAEAAAPPSPQQVREHRRHLAVLASAQVLSGLGNGAGLALGALLAAKLGGSESLGGTVAVAISLGGMLAALPLARAAMAAGRRPALDTGYLIGAAGAIGMIAAAGLGSYPLLLLSAAGLGVGSATNLQARFAATDGSAPGRRARDLSLVVWALTIGAVLGPSFAGPGARVAAAFGLPTDAGAFLFSAVGLTFASLMIWVGLRPDPLAPGVGAAPGHKPSLKQGLAALRGAPGAGVGVAAVAAGHACMVAVMSMTTIHLQHVYHGTGDPSPDVLALIGLTLSGHIGGMYALSPLVGWCVDRWGHRPALLAAQALFAASAIVCILAPQNHPLVSVALFVLGLAWSFSSITGSAVVSDRVPSEHRVAAQGLTDSAMSAGGVLAGLGSGALLQFLGDQGLNAASLAVAVVMTALILARMPRR